MYVLVLLSSALILGSRAASIADVIISRRHIRSSGNVHIRDLAPLGTNCTADVECESQKCWPDHWYAGQKICQGSPAGVACTDGSTCISGE